MKMTRNAVAVGVVVVIIAAGLYLSIQFVSDFKQASDRYRVWAIFPDASGLTERSTVRIAGIPVGYIEKIELQEYEADAGVNDKGQPVTQTQVGARVDVVVNGEVVLYDNAKALRGAGSLLGEQFIILVPGTHEQPKLKDGDQIKQTGDAGLMGNMDKIAGDIREVTNNMRSVFGSEEGGRQMGEVLANLRDISASINELLAKNTENVNRTLENIDRMAVETRPGLRSIVEDVRTITKEIRVFVENNTDKASSAVDETDKTIKDLRSAVGKLDRTLENLGDITEGVNKGEGTVGRLLKDDKLINDVEEVVEGASGLVEGAFKLQTIVGLMSEFNFYDNTIKTSLQLRLQPREDKYYLIEAIYDPRGATSREKIVVETTNPDDPAQYQETRRITKDTLLLSFMFARRLHFATFRFGIKESSGGIGLDLHILRDRVELTTDLYRFGEDVYPRLKELIAIEFLRHVYIIGGINDILNENRDYFVGAMLRFNDEDLKTMLMFSPSVSP